MNVKDTNQEGSKEKEGTKIGKTEGRKISSVRRTDVGVREVESNKVTTNIKSRSCNDNVRENAGNAEKENEYFVDVGEEEREREGGAAEAEKTLVDKEGEVECEFSGVTKPSVLEAGTQKVWEWTDDAECQQLMNSWSGLYNTQMRVYRKAYAGWKSDLKSWKSFSGPKKPTAPLTPEERKAKYIRNRNGAPFEEESKSSNNSGDSDTDRCYPSDYCTDEDPYDDSDAYNHELDRKLDKKERK